MNASASTGSGRLAGRPADRAGRRARPHARADDQPPPRRRAARQPPGHHARARQRARRVAAVPAGRRRAAHRLERHRRAPRRPTSASRSPTATSRRGSSSTRRRRCASARPSPTRRRSRSPPRPCVGFLTARNQNRLGAVLVAGPHLKVMPPRHRARPGAGRAHATSPSPPPSEGLGRSDLAGAIDRVAAISKRRGFVAVDRPTSPATPGSIRWPGSGCATTCWRSPSTTRASSTCRRSGWSRSSTRRPGRRREVRVTAAVQRRYAAAAAEAGRAAAARASAAPAPTSSSWRTDGDWLGAIVGHVTPPARPGRQRPGAAAMIAATDVPQPAAACGGCSPSLALGARLRRRAALAAAGDGALHAGRPARPGRPVPAAVGAATSSPRLQLLGLAAGVVAIARPISTIDRAHRERGPHPRAVRRVAVDDGDRRRRRPASTAAKAGGPEFVDQVADDIEVGLISFSGTVDVEVAADARPRRALDQGIETSSWPSRRRSATP